MSAINNLDNRGTKRAAEPLEDSSRRKFQTVADQGPPGSRSRSSSPVEMEKLAEKSNRYFRNLARDVITRAKRGGDNFPINLCERDFEGRCQYLLVGDYDIPPRMLVDLIQISPSCALAEFFYKTPVYNNNKINGEVLREAYFYEAIIRHAKKDPECFPLAKRAFAESQEAGIEFTKLYGSYIVTAGKNKDINEAKKAFDLAIKTGRADFLTCNFYVQALWDTGNKQEAFAIFQRYILPALKQSEKGQEFDFHRLSYAAARLYFEDIFDRISTSPFTVITGKGLHSSNAPFSMQEWVQNVALYSVIINWDWKVDEQNSGRLIFTQC